jgi:hypothetical protein
MDKTFKVFYRHPEGGFRYITSVKLSKDFPLPIVDELEEVFFTMQGENWSPHGEAREMILSLGVRHTSMSVGDLALDVSTGKGWLAEITGWKEFQGCGLA